jgi:hypothetical protein
MNNTYYVYAYLREDGTPYYIGKGHDDRYKQKSHKVKIPKDPSRIVIMEDGLTNIGALALERRYIQWYGRIDNGTGILRNMTDGGEGAPGVTPWNKGITGKDSHLSNKRSEEHKKNIGAKSKARMNTPEMKEKQRQIMLDYWSKRKALALHKG